MTDRATCTAFCKPVARERYSSQRQKVQQRNNRAGAERRPNSQRSDYADLSHSAQENDASAERIGRVDTL
ncbi:hypothetical protein [Neorhizobium sp. DAR64872/K0K18]|uniref:hypothetical protein n=1 Tax=Neorhizobium sp. DAR64872/K0K18 TaxID=3421958 RepID=UPI003D2896AA